MRMQQVSLSSLRDALNAGGGRPANLLTGVEASTTWGDLVCGTVLSGRGQELRGRSVLIMAADQFAAAQALIELDGMARRLVLYPPDLPLDHLSHVMRFAEVEAIVSDRELDSEKTPEAISRITLSPEVMPATYDRDAPQQTEWILLTSGTTGLPKMVLHTLASLTGAIEPGPSPVAETVWSTFYDIRRYGGLQIFLRAVLTQTSLVLIGPKESTADFWLAPARAELLTSPERLRIGVER